MTTTAANPSAPRRRCTAAVALAATVLAIVVAVGAGIDAHASTGHVEVPGTLVAAHNHPAGDLVGVEQAIAAGEGRGTMTGGSQLVVGSRVAPNTTGLIDDVVSSSRWSRTSFGGNRVYQRSDLIDPALMDRTGMSNLQRMQQGLAPIGPDGRAINLHHMLQTQSGPIAEVTATMHQQYSRILHINPSSIPSGINRGGFDAWRADYWMWRAKGF
ncbi:MAG: HNH/ENDO VII family nuclease [Acidimicrobiales bacterium]